MHLSKHYLDYLQPESESSSGLADSYYSASPTSRKHLPIELRHELLILSALSQLVAGVFIFVIVAGISKWSIPWWGILSMALGFTLAVYLLAGIGKWEFPLLMSLMLAPFEMEDGFYLVLLLLTGMAMLVSFVLFIGSTRGRYEELNVLGKWLYGVVGFLAVSEIAIMIFTLLFVIWFAMALGTSSSFG